MQQHYFFCSFFSLFARFPCKIEDFDKEFITLPAQSGFSSLNKVDLKEKIRRSRIVHDAWQAKDFAEWSERILSSSFERSKGRAS